MRKLFAVALAALMLAIMGGNALAADAATGTINGNLTNKTASGKSVADQEVTLGTYKGSQDMGKKTTKTDKDGKFTFDGLDTGADFTYQVSVTFQTAPYYSDPISFSASQAGQAPSATPTAPTNSKSVTIPVYDSTSDDSVMKSVAHHYLLEGDKDGIQVTEIIIINNTSDKSYVGKESHSGTNSTLKFTLPEGSTDFEPVDGLYPSRVLQVPGGFVDTMPVYPGMSQRVWRFAIPPTGDSASFSTKLDMPADKVSVLVPDEGATVTVTNLTGPASQDIQGAKYLLFSGQNVAANTEFQFKMDKLSNIKPQAPASSQPAAATTPAAGSSALPTAAIAAIVLVVVLVIGGAVFAVIRRRGSAHAGSAPQFEELDNIEIDPEGDLEAQRQELVSAIARLDDLFEQDKISSEEYGRIRTEKKRLLIEIVKLQKSDGAVSGSPR